MGDPAVALTVLALYCAIFGSAGRHIAVEKGRSMAEGFWFGVFFGPWGLLIVALLPDKRA